MFTSHFVAESRENFKNNQEVVNHAIIRRQSQKIATFFVLYPYYCSTCGRYRRPSDCRICRQDLASVKEMIHSTGYDWRNRVFVASSDV
jgi:hypothetical protein